MLEYKQEVRGIFNAALMKLIAPTLIAAGWQVAPSDNQDGIVGIEAERVTDNGEWAVWMAFDFDFYCSSTIGDIGIVPADIEIEQLLAGMDEAAKTDMLDEILLRNDKIDVITDFPDGSIGIMSKP
ncbi:MAG: hypothetical protein D6712_07770, partial [Chloroflexi bacterium]